MKEKYPFFPHCSVVADKIWKHELKKTVYDVLQNRLHPIGDVIANHYPYFVLINRECKSAVFFNRKYEIMYELKNNNIKFCEYRLVRLPDQKYETASFEGYTGEAFFFYNDATNPGENEINWIDYWQRVNAICKIVEGVPVFLRYIMWGVKELYVSASEIDKLSKENKILKNKIEALENYKKLYMKLIEKKTSDRG